MKHKRVFLAALVMFLGISASIIAQPFPLLSEHFEGTFPPSGWSVFATQGQNQWYRNDYWGRPNYTPGSSGYCADNDDDGAGPGAARVQDNILQSPAFDASGYQTVWLAYDVDWYPVGTGMAGGVDVYNGTSWSTVKGFVPGNRYTARDSINVTTKVAGVTNARIRFYYTELTGNVKSNWYEVDDVHVWGSDPPVPLDLVMVEIIRPKFWEQGGIPFQPSCRIYNNLDTTAHGSVSCKITNFTTMQVVYQEAHTSYPLNPGHTVVDFPPFTPLKNNSYNAFFVVEHPNDVDPTNNTMQRNFSTHETEYDVTPYEMLSPEDPQINPFEPTANYAERLGKTTVGVKMHCWIQDFDTEEWIYRDSSDIRVFEPYDTFMAVFDTAYLETGTYIIRFWANGESNTNISNPPLVDTFDYVGIAETPLPDHFSLDEISPNPVSDLTVVSFTLGRTTHLTLNVYDVAGNVVTVLEDGSRNAGYHSVNWNTKGVASGIYFIKLLTPEFTAYRKAIVLH